MMAVEVFQGYSRIVTPNEPDNVAGGDQNTFNNICYQNFLSKYI